MRLPRFTKALLVSNIPAMKIAVCVKQVPDSWAEKRHALVQ